MIDIKAYAKINLFLDIESRREDGYHNIKSVMQSVDWYDVIKISKSYSDLSINIKSNNKLVPIDSSNIVYKITKAFLKKCNINSGIDIYIEKNIPISAGMAGGSSDGAATLKGLNKLFGEPLSLDELIDMAKSIGADIPFLLIGGTKIVKGIGDIIESCHDIPECYFVCAKDDSACVSTPNAYKTLDKIYNNFNCYTPNDKFNKMINSLNISDLHGVGDNLFNIFEPVIKSKEKSVSIIKDILIKNGAINSIMSGSGPSVFGIFDNINSANIASNELNKLGINAKACKPVFEI